MSKVLSARVDDELAAWVESYRVERGWSRGELLGAALASFREDTKRGVPDLPAPPKPRTPAEERKRIEDAAYAEMQAAHMARQAKLNQAKEAAGGAVKPASKVRAVSPLGPRGAS